MILKQQGQDPDKDATLQSIRAAQAQYKDAISHFSGLAQQQATIDQQRQPGRASRRSTSRARRHAAGDAHACRLPPEPGTPGSP